MANVKYPEVGFKLPRSRFISGDAAKKKTTDHERKPLQPDKYHFWMAFAVPKTSPGAHEAVNGIVAHAWNTYQTVAGAANVMEKIKLGIHVPEGFSWKIDDGDTHPTWSKKDYCRGCYIFQPKTYFDTVNVIDNAHVPMDPSLMKHGDFVDLYVTSSINGQLGHTAGVHLNPNVVRWLETGPRIAVASADADTLMGPAVGTGYVAPQAGAMPSHMTTPGHIAPPPPPPGIPGHGGAAPGHIAPPPPMTPAAPPPPPAETNEAWNLRHTGQAAPGHRFNPTTGAWDVAPAAPPPPPPLAPVTPPPAPETNEQWNIRHTGHVAPGHRFNPATGAWDVAAPQPATGLANASLHGQPVVGSGPYSPQNPPPVTPNPNFAGGPPRLQ